jgi:5-methyltetrahydropteroyltriglutamate--homocysteine methyltransferase
VSEAGAAGRARENRLATTHAGSLPRPRGLVELFVRRARGEPIAPAALQTPIEEATRAVVARQLAAGIDVPSNGEQPREAFFLYVQRRMSGFAGRGVRPPQADVAHYPGFQALRQRWLGSGAMISNFEVPKVVGAVRHLDPGAVERECDDFRRILEAARPGGGEAFVTAPSPGIIAAAVPNEHYDTDAAYLEALAAALRVEYETIVRQGFLLQIDAPDLALERHVSFAERPLTAFVGFVERVIDAINRALRDVPPGRVRLHVCWGNYEGPHDRDVPLRDILPLLRQARAGTLVLPFANPRHAHEYRLLAADGLPADRSVVAGVIDTTTNYVEHPEVVADRLERVARAVGDPARVAAGTDCGFDTSAGMGRVAEDVVWAKLAALAAGARLASARLFAAAGPVPG